MRPLLFIHIPKNAGTTIARVLEPINSRYTDNEYEDGINEDEDATYGHIDVKELYMNGFISPLAWDNYFKFCFVRNPWDRMVSLYKYLNKGESFARQSSM